MTDETSPTAEIPEAAEIPATAVMPATPEAPETVAAVQPDASATTAPAADHVSIPKRWLVIGGSVAAGLLIVAAVFGAGVSVGHRAGAFDRPGLGPSAQTSQDGFRGRTGGPGGGHMEGDDRTWGPRGEEGRGQGRGPQGGQGRGMGQMVPGAPQNPGTVPSP